ncbi:hypothetical protein BDQ17DRAFT_1457999 [Cyathus striatus]|nr:hypothetical protein BDQ17DRAFT_1457999 [Cyathus striatus]
MYGSIVKLYGDEPDWLKLLSRRHSQCYYPRPIPSRANLSSGCSVGDITGVTYDGTPPQRVFIGNENLDSDTLLYLSTRLWAVTQQQQQQQQLDERRRPRTQRHGSIAGFPTQRFASPSSGIQYPSSSTQPQPPPSLPSLRPERSVRAPSS